MISSAINQLSKIRWSIFILPALIASLGIYNLESAARSSMPNLHITQLIWLIAGLVITLIIASIDYRYTQRIAYFFYIFVCILLLLVLINGKLVSGSRRWLHLLFFNLQPSELMKVSIILLLARYLSHRDDKSLFTLRSLIRPLNITRPLTLLLLIPVGWSTPFLKDPVGELARWLFKFFNGTPPPIENTIWFRLLLLSIGTAGFILFISMHIFGNQQKHVLEASEQTRTKVPILLATLGYALFSASIVWFWNSTVLKDPIRALINRLVFGAQVSGIYHTLQATYTLRILLIVLASAYLFFSLFAIYYRGWRGMISLIAPIDLIALPAILIVIEPDLGTTLILLAISGSMLLFVGIKRQSLVIMLVTIIISSGIAWAGLLKDYQKRRIITFLDPEYDAQGAGYHSIQSLIAVGSGKVWGKGHGKGTQTQLRFLPEQHTDFAFSVWAEETGFIGCVLLLAIYLVLLVLLLLTALTSPDEYARLICVGTTALIFWHLLVNVGMVLGLLPVVGVTLPFFSYGGSSLITMLSAIGIALATSVPIRTFKERL